MLLFVDKLTNSDFSYLDPERGLLGETWLSNVELEGLLDEQGMICDFGIVKSVTRNLLDDLIDHRLLVPGRAANLQIEERNGSSRLRWTLSNGEYIDHVSPTQCITVVDAERITPESVARWCEGLLRERLPGQISQLKLRFSTEEIPGPWYQYSHGLKKHAGKCQRIAHGHRSKIEILRNGQAAPDLEQQWAEILRDSYIGSRADLQAGADVPEGYLHFAYESQEGQFSLQLPERFCHLMDEDTTVEQIALHIAESIKAEEPDNTITVRAYEGLAKGALVRR